MDNPDIEELEIEEPEIESRDAPLLCTLGTHGALIHPVERALKLELRYHAENAIMMGLKEYLGNALYAKLKKTVFGDLVEYIESNFWRYKGRLISMLYFHSVYPDNEDELHFQMRSKRLKFGRREFGMMMGLRFGDANAEVSGTSMCFSEGCDLRKFKSSVTLTKIEAAFGTATGDDIKLRMGIVYFIYGVLIGLEPKTIIPSRIFYIVEDLELVENFPCGEFLFKNLMLSWSKIVIHCLTLGISRPKTEKPNISGCLYALQFWIFHAMPNIASRGQHAVLIEGNEHDLPCFKRWQCTEGGVYYKTLLSDKVQPWEDIPDDVVKTEDDKSFLLTLGLPEAEVRATGRVVEVPPVIVASPPPVTDRAHARRPHRERPDVADDDVPRSQHRRMDCTSTSTNPQGAHRLDDIGEDSVSLVSVISSEQILRIVQPYLEKTNAELRQVRGELSDVKAELSRSNSEASAMRTEFKKLDEKHSQLMNYCETMFRQRAPLQQGMDGNESSRVHDTSAGLRDATLSTPLRPVAESRPGQSSIPHGMDGTEISRGHDTSAGQREGDIDIMPLSCEDLTLPSREFSLGGNVDVGDRQATNASSFMSVSFDDITVHGIESYVVPETTDYQHMPCTSNPSGVVTKRDSRRGRKRGMQTLRTAMNLRDTTKQTSVTKSRSSRWITSNIGYNRHSTTRRIPYDDSRVIYDWISSHGEPETVPLIDGLQDGANISDYPADREFFRLLMLDRGQIVSQHIDAYVGLLHARMRAHPDQYKHHVRLCYNSFTMRLVEELEKWDYDMSVPCDGVLDFQSNQWSNKSVAYAIWMVTDVHWVLVVMDLDMWTVTVYNSRYGMGDLQRIDSVIDKWCKYMRILLRTSEGCRGMQQMLLPGELPFYKAMVPIDACPQTDKWELCGLYTLKFMELLIVNGGDLDAVNSQSIQRFRKKMAVDLYTRNLAV